MEDSVSGGFAERFAWEDVPRCRLQVVSGESLCLSYKVVNLVEKKSGEGEEAESKNA